MGWAASAVMGMELARPNEAAVCNPAPSGDFGDSDQMQGRISAQA